MKHPPEAAQEDMISEIQSEDDFEVTEESDFESSEDEEEGSQNTFDVLMGGKGDKSDAFSYQRGSNVSRQTLWRVKRKQQEMEQEAKKQKTLSQFFKPTASVPTTAPAPTQTEDSGESWAIKLEKSIVSMNRFLKSSGAKNLSPQDLKRHNAVLSFMNLQKQQHKKTRPGKLVRCKLSLQAAESYGRSKWYSEMIRKWERSWIQDGKIAEGKQGRATVRSWLTDEGLELFIREWIKKNESITAYKLAIAVTEYLRSDRAGELMNDLIGRAISGDDEVEGHSQLNIRVRTVKNWLNKLGLVYSRIGKGIFKDGHEREDVVLYRQERFLPKFMGYKQIAVRFTENKEMTKPDGVDSPVVFVTQDESCFNANDGPTHQWMVKGEPPIRAKGRGKGIMISEFLTPAGRLCCQNAEGLTMYATEMLETGSGKWWKGEDLVAQVRKAIFIFKSAFPGCKGVWLFDNATGHSIYAPDALLASAMNMNPGGKDKPLMRDGWYTKDGRRVVQKMYFEPADPVLGGEPKGIKHILKERGLWRDGLRASCKTIKDKAQRTCAPSNDCCAMAILAHQPDFLEQKCLIEEILNSEGQDVLFLPKFHCELNWIEQFWGACKRYTREHSTGSITGLRENIPAAMDSVHNGVSINRFFEKSLRIMTAYHDGLKTDTEEFSTRVYKSHRRLEDKSRW